MSRLGESLIRGDFVAAFIHVVDVELVVGHDEVGAGHRTGKRVRVLRRQVGVGSRCQAFCSSPFISRRALPVAIMTCSFAVCQCEGIVHAPVDFTRIVDAHWVGSPCRTAPFAHSGMLGNGANFCSAGVTTRCSDAAGWLCETANVESRSRAVVHAMRLMNEPPSRNLGAKV